MNQENLSALYLQHIGYDPFIDDPTITVEEVKNTLDVYLVERLIEDRGFSFFENGGGTKILRKGKLVVSGADGDLPGWNWFTIATYENFEDHDCEPEFCESDFSAEFPDMNEPRDFFEVLNEAEKYV